MNKQDLISIIKTAPIEEVFEFKVGMMKVVVEYQNLYSKSALLLALNSLFAVFLFGLGLNVQEGFLRVILAACFAFQGVHIYQIIITMKELRTTINDDLELLQAAQKRIQAETKGE